MKGIYMHQLADQYGTACIEALNISDLTKYESRTQAEADKGKAKAGLSRGFLFVGLAQLGSLLDCKAHRVVRVVSKHTDQICRRCVHLLAGNGGSQMRFECAFFGYFGNVAVNAALDIMGLGIGATGRAGRSPLPIREFWVSHAQATPMSSQGGRQRLLVSLCV